MTHFCTVNSFAQLLHCQRQNCYASPILCQKCFEKEHVTIQSGQKVVHQYLKLNQSPLLPIFHRVYKLQKSISSKLKSSIIQFQANTQNLVLTSLIQSKLFEEIFGNDQILINQFFALRTVYLNQQFIFYQPISHQFVERFKNMTQLKVGQYRKIIQSQSKEIIYMQAQFDLLSGTNSDRLDEFILLQQKCFGQYCQKLTQNKVPFSIYEYIEQRKKLGDKYPIDQIYYSREFQNFLIEKYQKNSQEQTIFNVVDYLNNFWKYLSIIVKGNSLISQYFNAQIKACTNYLTAMQSISLEPSYLGFRIWKSINYPNLYQLSQIKNHYFYQTFIFTFINLSIKQKKYNNNQLLDWQQFLLYLKDYSIYSQNIQSIIVNINQYEDYFLYRKQSQKFLKHIQENKQIIYDKKIAIEYLNQSFKISSKPALKKYKQYLQKQKINQLKKKQQFHNKCQQLKQQLKIKQQNRFYQYVFINYLSYVNQQKRQLSQKEYFQYKNAVLQEIDQDYVKLEDQKFKQSVVQYQKEIQQIQGGQLNQVEAQLAEKIENIEKGEVNEEVDSQEDDDLIQLCLCCKGHPYECQQEQCKAFGCCTACMLT